MNAEEKYDFKDDPYLNEYQNNAIRHVFENHVTFIKGPPGCGKTVTTSKMVIKMAAIGLKLIVGSCSNVANLTLVTRIIE